MKFLFDRFARLFFIAGSVVGVIGIFTGCCLYLLFWFKQIDQSIEDDCFKIMSGIILASLPFMLTWKWQLASDYDTNADAIRFLQPDVRIRAFLRGVLWVSFSLLIFHVLCVFGLPHPEQQDPTLFRKLMAVFHIFLGGLITISSLYGVRSLAVYRFFDSLRRNGFQKKQPRKHK